LPNTLAHVAAQGILARPALGGLNPRWLLLGCVLPDVPWIANRALLVLAPSLDAHALRLYVIAQASLACCVLLCGAFALLARRRRRVFLVLTSSAVLHLLLDASQTKWGNGVHLFAPLSWQEWNLELFWPENPLTGLLTLLGLGVSLWAIRASYRDPIVWVRPPLARVAAALALLVAYLGLPALWMDGPDRADSHSVRTLHEAAGRAGQRAAFDRTGLHVSGGRAFLVVRGEEVALVGETLDRPARVSIRGRFIEPHLFEVEEIHEHRFPRDQASYAGLALVAASWVAGLRRWKPAASAA
jgi:membrane-bound metal-dependent hydrolase YbcI (DUF457 family)